eukprot:gene6693-10858_t
MKKILGIRKYSKNFKEISQEWLNSSEKPTKFINVKNEKILITKPMVETYKNLNNKLEQEPNKNEFSGIYLLGQKNSGKTTIINSLVEFCSKNHENWLIYHIKSCVDWISLGDVEAAVEYLKIIKKELKRKNLLSMKMNRLPNKDTIENWINLGIESTIDPIQILGKTFQELKSLEYPQLFIFDDYHEIFQQDSETGMINFTIHPYFLSLQFNRLFKNACFLYSSEPTAETLFYIHTRKYKFIYTNEITDSEFDNYLELHQNLNKEAFHKIPKTFENVKLLENISTENEVLSKFNEIKSKEYLEKIENFKTMDERYLLILQGELFKFLTHENFEVKSSIFEKYLISQGLGYIDEFGHHFNDNLSYQLVFDDFKKNNYNYRLVDSTHRFDNITTLAFKTLSLDVKRQSLKTEFLLSLLESEYHPFDLDLIKINEKKDEYSMRISDRFENIKFKLPMDSESIDEKLKSIYLLPDGTIIIPSRKLLFKILSFNIKEPIISKDYLNFIKSNDYSLVFTSWEKNSAYLKGDISEIREFLKDEKFDIYVSCVQDYLRDYPNTVEYFKELTKENEEIENFSDELNWKSKDQMEGLITSLKVNKHSTAKNNVNVRSLHGRQRRN